ncbi:hypothetical protein KKB18_07385, partial [bacterium]|nr:hypothetical protein [bacterium]
KEQRMDRVQKLHEKYLDLLNSNIITDTQFIKYIKISTFDLLLNEMFDNISEHSQAQNAFILAQYWGKHKSCEFCILDDGIGLFGSLKNANRDVKDDYDALRKIVETGLSAKNEDGIMKRGTGIANTLSVLTNEIVKGEFFIMSGNSYFRKTTKVEEFSQFDDYSWQGTIVMLRLNKPKEGFDLYEYIK